MKTFIISCTLLSGLFSYNTALDAFFQTHVHFHRQKQKKEDMSQRQKRPLPQMNAQSYKGFI